MDNPFRPTKFEWEKRPVIWLSTRAKNILSTIKPVYISGSRGSGKTTILRSLSTRQISGDQLLKQQFGGRRLRWFGQYLQFNATFQERTAKIIDVLRNHDKSTDLAERIFCTYFEISLVLNFLNDMVFFQDTDFLHLRSKMEAKACAEFCSILQGSKWVKGKAVVDFQDARRLAREIQGEFLKSEGQFDADGVLEVINAFSPGALVRFIRDYAIAAIHSANFASEDLDFFILLDDCESLSDEQQIALNTYIRRTEGVAKWVISYLTDRYNSTATYIRNTTLNGDDRELVLLNEMTEADFSEFSEQVANLRIKKYLDSLGNLYYSEKHVRFTLDGAFGKTVAYNKLIEDILRRSENRELDKFRNDVAVTKGALVENILPSMHSTFSCGKGQMPYIEHIVISALGIKISEYESSEEQSSLSKTIDGKQAAAYIAFCAKYRQRPIYFGSNYIKALSDRCIRDFLDTMAVFFDRFLGHQSSSQEVQASARVKAALSFLRDKPITSNHQSSAIVEASRIKFANLDQLSKAEPEIVRLVRSLSALQQRLEHDFIDWRSVRFPVRGKFSVSFPREDISQGLANSLRAVRDIISRLEFDRYIKQQSIVDTPQSTVIVFSLHRRLRPYLRCGYSGPYDPVITLSPLALLEVMRGDNSFEPEKWADDLYSRIANVSQSVFFQQELPL